MSKISNLNSSCLKVWGESCQCGDNVFVATVRMPAVSGSIGGIDLEYTQPTLIMRESDAAIIQSGSIITVRGKSFFAGAKLPDGFGFVTINITEAQEITDENQWR